MLLRVNQREIPAALAQLQDCIFSLPRCSSTFHSSFFANNLKLLQIIIVGNIKTEKETLALDQTKNKLERCTLCQQWLRGTYGCLFTQTIQRKRHKIFKGDPERPQVSLINTVQGKSKAVFPAFLASGSINLELWLRRHCSTDVRLLVLWSWEQRGEARQTRGEDLYWASGTSERPHWPQKHGSVNTGRELQLSSRASQSAEPTTGG